jgi:hypothetical protein
LDSPADSPNPMNFVFPGYSFVRDVGFFEQVSKKVHIEIGYHFDIKALFLQQRRQHTHLSLSSTGI